MVEHTALQDRQWITLWRWAGGGSVDMYVRVRVHACTCISAHTTHTALRHRMYVRTNTLSCRIPSSPLPPPPCLNLNRLLSLYPRLHAVVYHSSPTRSRPLIQSEYKCCPLKQAGNGGKPSTTSTTELFLRPRLFSSSFVVCRALNEYVWLPLAAAKKFDGVRSSLRATRVICQLDVVMQAKPTSMCHCFKIMIVLNNCEE